MDEGFNSLVAHLTRPPIDITNEAAGSKGNHQAARQVIESRS
jgi:hypothetical protein